MADDILKATDPHNVPVTFVNQVSVVGHLNGVVNLTLAVANFSETEEAVVPDLVVASRLRFDLNCAQTIWEHLGRILQQNTTQSPKVTN